MTRFTELTSEQQDALLKGHRHKLNLLIEEIYKLKISKSQPILKVAAFLLEIQAIEFHLIILITELELASSMEPNFIKKTIEEMVTKCCKKPIKVKSKEPYDMTLGEMKDEISKFKAPFLEKLTVLLEKLNKLRRKYAHHLFSGLDSWDKVLKDVEEGIKIDGKVIHELSVISKTISTQSEYGKIMSKKISNDDN